MYIDSLTVRALNLGDPGGGKSLTLTADSFLRLSVSSPATATGDYAAAIAPSFGISFDGLAPTTHPLLFTGMTLAASSNLIRGIDIAPTRASGWTSFTGTVTTTPAAVYTDYRELHTNGAAEVLGFGSFPYMDSGASGKSMFALQAICEADSGATVAAATAVGDGVFPVWAKCLINGAGFNASAVAAAAFLSFQANVTDVQAADTSMINMEVASGGIQSIFKFQCSAAKGATYFANFEDNGEPAEKTTAKSTATNDVVGNVKVLIGDQVGYVNVHSAKAT